MFVQFPLIFNKRHMNCAIEHISSVIGHLFFSVHDNLLLTLSQNWLLRVRMIILRIQLSRLICSSCLKLVKLVFYWVSISLRLAVFRIWKWFFYLSIASAVVVRTVDRKLRKIIRTSFKLTNYLACRANWPARILFNP